MTYFISDYHFFHDLARIRSRDEFADVDEMNEYIIRQNNAVVKSDDVLYILGDVIVCSEKDLVRNMEATVGRLTGHLQLILGNHDYRYRTNPDFTKYFESVQESKTFLLQKRWVQLYHYPVLNWYRRNKGGIHIFGHMHNETACRDYEIMASRYNAFNVSVEEVNYKPVSFTEILQELERRRVGEEESASSFIGF